MKIYVYKNCDGCKKAVKWLEARDLSFKAIEIDLNPPSAAQLKKWHKASGLPLKKFFNTSGKLYREMGLSKKMETLEFAETFNLLASNGMLIKRPLLVKDDTVLLGFKADVYAELV